MAKNILITGLPGCGKSTLIKELISGRRVGGITTPEVRRGGWRWGFEIIDLSSSDKGVLASIDIKEGPAVGRYRVNLEDLNEVGSKALEEAVNDPRIEIIVIDEIGKMECFSERFKQAVVAALDSEKRVLATISYQDFDPFIHEIKTHPDTHLFYLRREDFEKVFNRVKRFLER